MDEVTACALNAIELDKQHGDEAVQVRVTMGKEPTHFLAIFKGKLVIYEVRWARGGAGTSHRSGAVMQAVQETRLVFRKGSCQGCMGWQVEGLELLCCFPSSLDHHMCKHSAGLAQTQLSTPELRMITCDVLSSSASKSYK